MRYEVLFGGYGGQGVILAAQTLATAVGVYEGCEVAQSQSYGPEARGGACRAEVIIADEPIDYVRATRVDCLVAMSQQAFDRYLSLAKTGAWLVIDSTLVCKLPEDACGDAEYKLVAMPATELAEREVGWPTAANMIMLGAAAAITRLASPGSLEKAVAAAVPAKTLDLNLKAVRLGYRRGQAEGEAKGVLP